MKFIVHSAEETTVAVVAKLDDGTEVSATMTAFVVELVPVDSWRSTITLTEVPKGADQWAAVRANFPKGAEVELNGFTVTKEPAE